MNRLTGYRGYVVGLAFWALALFLALEMGAADHATVDIITKLRLPRALLASAVGMGLAVSGCVLQALFANPLCEPYTLGISSGAALGTVIGMALGVQFSFIGLAGTAFVGAMIFAVILFLVSLKQGSSNLILLLTGVMLGVLGSSLVALWMTFADLNGVQGSLSWLLGDLSSARIGGSLMTLILVVILSGSLWFHWRELDALLLGEEAARSLGFSIEGSRRKFILLTSLLVGLCVSGSGIIGFVGLMVPHFARKMVGSLHLKLVPLCAIWGAATLTFADMMSRSLFKPFELPVGVMTAVIGAPLFMWIMLRNEKKEAQ
ncbi:iron ABC transporter permease [bacterium]|jgi:iron complex transport system permease protein|nr:iron ABC transporter permease [bacterium]